MHSAPFGRLGDSEFRCSTGSWLVEEVDCDEEVDPRVGCCRKWFNSIREMHKINLKHPLRDILCQTAMLVGHGLHFRSD